MASIHFSDHAIDRFEQRLGTRFVHREIVAAGKHAPQAPACVQFDHSPSDGFWIAGDAVFPLREASNGLVATTCLKRRRLSKADRRERRENAREDWAA